MLLSLERGRRWGTQESAVAEYFRMLANGYDKSERHNAYFRFLFSHDMQFNDHAGMESLTTTLTQYSDEFASVQLQCIRLEAVCHDFAENDEGREMVVVEASALVRLRVDWKTVAALFPHLQTDLVVRLVGHVLVLPIRLTFAFNDRVKVARHTSEANIVLALYNQFGNLADASLASAKTRIKPNAEIVPS
ncbi:hypothetical protein DYB32_009382 [Aphanomyces invadans]|uniref:Uncharacterized protein n=1 Tax=Aphanomyces invadans TaxID=157072 RepID=A0A3R6YSP8_9STRA|nr:hypothetical protein DYB32_009382 [Aphanomyces invadans]